MEWPFEVFVPRPLPQILRGVAEIAGNAKGDWAIKDIWVEHGPQRYRLANYDERQEIAMNLHMMAGGAIGRAYRDSVQELDMSTEERIREMLRAGDRPADIAQKLHISTYRVLMTQKRMMGLPARLGTRRSKPKLIQGPAHWYG